MILFCLFALPPTNISVVYVRVFSRKITVVRKLFRILWRRSFREFCLPWENAHVVLTQSPSRDIAQTGLDWVTDTVAAKSGTMRNSLDNDDACATDKGKRGRTTKYTGGRATVRGEERTEQLRSTYRKRGMCLRCTRLPTHRYYILGMRVTLNVSFESGL